MKRFLEPWEVWLSKIQFIFYVEYKTLPSYLEYFSILLENAVFNFMEFLIQNLGAWKVFTCGMSIVLNAWKW